MQGASRETSMVAIAATPGNNILIATHHDEATDGDRAECSRKRRCRFPQQRSAALHALVADPTLLGDMLGDGVGPPIWNGYSHQVDSTEGPCPAFAGTEGPRMGLGTHCASSVAGRFHF